MSSYDDPRWYEQPAQNDNQMQPTQQPAYSEFSSFPPYIAPDINSATQQRMPQQSAPGTGHSKRRVVGQVALFVVLFFLAFLGGWFSRQAYTTSFFNASNQSQSYANLIQQAWTIIDQHYVDRKAVDYKQMSYQAIQAMLNVLHDKGHTRFLTPADVKAENQQLSGTFTGVGLYLRQDKVTKQLIITSPVPGSPAEKAGFMHGDIIVSVNGVSTAGKDIAGVSTLIQGPAGTSVSITVQRPATHQTLTIKVTRAEIKTPNVVLHYIAQDHIAHIQIVQFADGVSSQLKDTLGEAKKLGATKIILDLREDPGGWLNEAVNTASEFLKSGNVLVEQDSSGQRTPDPVSGSPVNTTTPIVVLVNGDTASAAEIVSAALKDNHRAIIMGEKTFGTGTELNEFYLADGSALLLGTTLWLTPDGQFIRDKGLAPNIIVTNPSGIILTPNDENSATMSEQQILTSGDAQLAAAIQYLDSH